MSLTPEPAWNLEEIGGGESTICVQSKCMQLSLGVLFISMAFAGSPAEWESILERQAKCLEYIADNIEADIPSNSDHTLFFLQVAGARDTLYVFNRQSVYTCAIPAVTPAAELLPSYYSQDLRKTQETYRLEILNLNGQNYLTQYTRPKDPSEETFSVKVLESKGRENWRPTACTETLNDQTIELVSENVLKRIESSYSHFVLHFNRRFAQAKSGCDDPIKKAKDKFLSVAGEKIQGALNTKAETPEECLKAKYAELEKEQAHSRGEILAALKQCESAPALRSSAIEIAAKFKAHEIGPTKN